MNEVTKENRAIGKLEQAYLTESRTNIYTIFRKAEFHWDLKDVLEFDQMWKVGIPIELIAAHFGRSKRDTELLMIDRFYEGKIDARPGFLKGRAQEKVCI